MASRTTKVAATVGVLALIGMAFAGGAKADDLIDGGDDDEPVPPPPPPGTDEDPPDLDFPPPGPVCNYSGCGNPFDATHEHPTQYCIRIQQLGYPIDCALVASTEGGSHIAVNPQRAWISKYQQESNKVRNSAALAAVVVPRGQVAIAALNAIKVAGPLVPDGLVGKNTIPAMARSLALQNATGIPWRNLVALAV